MNEQALQLLYDEMSTQYEVGTFEDFKEYLLDDEQRSAFFEEAIKPNYDVNTLEEFDQVYGLKKKEDFISENPELESQLDKDFSGIPIFKFISDAVGRGVAQGRTADEAITLLRSGSSATDEEVEEYIKAVGAMDSYTPSESMQQFQRDYINEGGDTSAFLSALWKNMEVAPEVLLQSFAGMATAAATAEGAAISTVGAAAGAGAGSFIPGVGNIVGGITGAMSAANGTLETATSMTEFIKEKLDEDGKEFNAQNVRSLLEDEDAFTEIKVKSLQRGGIIAAVDLIGGGVAGRATKGVAQMSKMGAKATKLAQVGTGLGIEAVAGGGGEALARGFTGQEMDAAEIGLEAIAGLSTAPFTIGGAMRQSTYKLGGQNLTRKEMLMAAEKTPEQFADKSLELKNVPKEDEVLLKNVQEREKVKKNLPDDTPEGKIDEIIEKQIEADKLKNKESIAAKQRLKEIEKEIESLRKPGEEVEAEATEAQEAPFETKRVRITEPMTIGQSEVTFNEDGTINTIVNKKTRKPVSPATRRKVEKKVLQDVIDIDAGKMAPDPVGVQPNQVPDFILQQSENVREIAQAIREEEKLIQDEKVQAEQLFEETDLTNLIGLKFTSESWKGLTGQDPSKSRIKKVWIDDTNGVSIEDGWAEALAREGELPVDTTERVDVNDVINFIKTNNTQAKINKLRATKPQLKTQTLLDLEQKFEDLTGAKATQTNIDTVISIEEGRIPVEVLKAQEKEMLRMQAEEPGVFGKKKGPSAKKIVGERKPEPVTVDAYEALKDQIKLEARAAREKKYSMDQARTNLGQKILELAKSGNLSVNQAKTFVRRISNVNLDNPIKTEELVSYFSKIFENAENQQKLKTAENIKKAIRKIKRKDVDASVRGAVKDFLKINTNILDNVDEYVEVANNIVNGLKRSRVVNGVVKLSSDVNLNSLLEYVSRELPRQTAIREQATIDKYESILGDQAEGMSYQEMKDAVNALTESEDTAEARAKERAAIKSVFDEISAIVNEVIDFGRGAPEVDDVYDVGDLQKALIKRFTEMNLDLLTTKESMEAIDALKNFLVNGTTGGMMKTLSNFKGRSAARSLLGDGFAGYKLNMAGTFWGRNLATLNILSEFIFRSQTKGLKFFQESGLQGIMYGNSKSIKDHEVLQERYDKKYAKSKANGESFTSAYNIIERGMIAFAIRNLQGTAQEQVNEFVRRKRLIEQSIEVLKRQGGELAKRGKMYEDAYIKILDDSVNANEVASKADPTNVDAVNWWINEWSNIYPSLYDVSLNVYNKLLTKDTNYTPDFHATTKEVLSEQDLLEPGFQEDTARYLYDKESRTLKETKRPQSLNEQRASYINLNFDRANLNAYKAALVDVNTAESVSALNGFINDASFNSLIQDDGTRNLLKERIFSYVRNIKGGNIPTKSEEKTMSKYFDKISTFAVGRALGGPTQFPKQLVPIVNTLINAGELAIQSFNKPGAKQFILKSGYGIASRGFASVSEISNVDTAMKSIDRFDSEFFGRIDKINRSLLKLFLQNPDRYAAQISWLTYYIKNLKSQGFSQEAIDNIDWETHSINTDAADYAQQQVDRQQNVSDAALQGEFFSSRNVYASLARKVFLPFMNFAMNQKSRMYSDFLQLSSKYTTEEDRARARTSLAGLAVETLVFNTLGLGISMALYGATKAITGTEESEEEQSKRVWNIIKGRGTNIAVDVFSPFPRLTDNLVIEGLNRVFRAAQEGDEEAIFQLFSRDEATLIEQLGLFGIPFKNTKELIEVISIAFTGEYKNKYGKVIELDQDAQKIAREVLLPKIMYVMGVAPVEVGTMSNYAMREAKKLKVKKTTGKSKYQRVYRY